MIGFLSRDFPLEEYKALVRVSSRDQLLGNQPHANGWGYFIFMYRANSWSYITYKSPLPIYEDEIYVPRAEKYIGLIHSRRSSKKFLKGVQHSHPYLIKIDSYEIALAHNGSVQREAFKELAREPYTDSYLILLLLKDKIHRGRNPEEALKELVYELGNKATSLNILLLVYTPSSGPSLCYSSFYNPNRIREEEMYYKMYLAKEANRTIIASSSIALNINLNWKEINNGDCKCIQFDN
jgi:glutamine amidotransferase